MGMLDYLQEEWRNLYKPFQRYPTIYGKQARQGWGMLTEDAPGAWDIATKPLGALMMSGIPSLYEAFRDEPIRSTLINDLDIDPKTAGYATQAIGLGMDVGVPYTVIRKGLTPWISEQVAKQANPTRFSPSRRRFLKGTGAAAVGTATGIPLLKQVAKTVPDAFDSLLGKMSSTAGSIGVKGTVVAGMNNFSRRFADLAYHLVYTRRHREAMLADPLKKKWKPGKGGPSWARKLRVYRKAHPVDESAYEKIGGYYTGTDEELTVMRNSIRDRVNLEQKEFVDRSPVPGYPKETLYSPNFSPIQISFGHVERAKAHYEADPKGFILALEDIIKIQKRKEKDYDDYSDLVYSLEDFLKELKAGL